MIETLARFGAAMSLVFMCFGVVADERRVPLPEILPATKGDRCVEPSDVMRREHMSFLMHQRDDTVHLGIRGAKHSLVGCIGCHAQTSADGARIPVNAEGQFCESCHGFAGVEIDCFGCHAAVPAESPARGALPTWMSPRAQVIAGVRREKLE